MCPEVRIFNKGSDFCDYCTACFCHISTNNFQIEVKLVALCLSRIALQNSFEVKKGVCIKTKSIISRLEILVPKSKLE